MKRGNYINSTVYGISAGMWLAMFIHTLEISSLLLFVLLTLLSLGFLKNNDGN